VLVTERAIALDVLTATSAQHLLCHRKSRRTEGLRPWR